MKRREFVIKTGIVGTAFAVAPALACNTPQKEVSNESKTNPVFEQAALGYDYAALEPVIDARTMEIHYTKHHAGYVKKLNEALETHPFLGADLQTILKNVTHEEADIAVLNNAGGHYNHTLFWNILKPGGAKEATGDLRGAMESSFGSMENFSEQFTTAASKVFGSGWAWLVLNNDNKLEVVSTQNQENPLMEKVLGHSAKPILGIDVWEHAYYLKYQNRRKEYIDGFMSLINWDAVAANLKA